MGSGTVNHNITKAVKQARNSQSLLEALRRFSSSVCQIWQRRATNIHPIHSHRYAFLPIINPSSTLLPEAHPHPMSTSWRRSFLSSTASQPFDKMPQRPEHQHDTPLCHALGIIRSSLVEPDIVTAMFVHCLALKLGVLADLPTSTSILTVYSRAGYFGHSRALFNEIYLKDVIIWNAMITASLENQCFGLAVDFFVEMIENGTGFDSTTLLLVVSAFSHLNCLKQGQIIHSLSIKTGTLSDCNLTNALMGLYAKCGNLSSLKSMFEGMEYSDVISWNTVMTGCLNNNHPAKALWYFREMAYEKQPDSVSLSCAISASYCLGELRSCQVIHGWGIKLGCNGSSNISVANSLISSYSRCGDIDAAIVIFTDMMDKDVVSWNAMIDGFASNGMAFESFDLLHEMQISGYVVPDMVTMVTILPICSELVLLREGRAVHGYILRRDMGSNILVMNSLMDMYSKCGSIIKAELLFNNMPKKDLVSWNSMISGYSQNGQFTEAQDLFKDLLCWGSQFSLSTLLAILPSCNSPESLKFGESIHCLLLKFGFSKNLLAVNCLMLMYVDCGDLTAAFSLLRRVSAVGDIDCWNTVIVGCTQNGNFQEALETFNLMRQHPNVNHDSVTLVSAISACGNFELVFAGKYIHGLAIKTLLESDIRVQNALITMYGRCKDIESARSVFNSSSNLNLCSWNCMISAFSQNKAGRSVLQLFSRLEFEPNEITIVGILSASAQLGLIRHGKQIHGHVVRFAIQDNSFISAALVEMYSNCGRLDLALQVFRNSQEKSVAAWNTMISAYGYHGIGEKAIELFHDMCKSGTRATKSTFISLLSACSHSGLVNKGLWFYKHMLEEYAVEPVTEHHVCLVDMLGRSGKLHEAFEFIKQMQMPAKPGIWGALLSACNYHGDLETGRNVANLLFELEPENVGYYISLSNMYAAAGRWKEAVELRSLVEDKQLKKPSAYSLIDVGLG